MLVGPEILGSLAAFGVYEVRRARIILAMNVITCIVTACGIWSKLTVSYWGLMLHGFFMCCVLGGFFIYIYIEYFLTADRSNGTHDLRDEEIRKEAMGDTSVQVLISLPLLLLFAMGIVSLRLFCRIDEIYEEREKRL